MAPRPLHVVIAGAGVAGLEALLALRALAEDRVTIEVVAPDEEFTIRALEVGEAFALGNPRRYSVRAIADARGASLRHDEVREVRVRDRVAFGRSGAEYAYDVLLLAIGARAVPAVDGALTYTGRDAAPALRHVLSELRAGAVRRVAFVVPYGASWPLPAYELALLTAREAREDRELVVVSPEDRPLERFGRRASEEVAGLLRGQGIEFVGRATAERAVPGELQLAGGDVVAAERVVAQPRMVGRKLIGLPRADADGFVVTDPNARVIGADGVWAAGDACHYRVKQGGLAAQQADAAAHDIAATAGAPVTRQPFEPVLRGMLLTGGAPRYLRAGAASHGRDTSVADHPLWWPPSKVAGRHLSEYLGAAHDRVALDRHDAVPIEVRLEREVAAAHGEHAPPPSYRLPTTRWSG